jgi:Ca2+-binding RTX toxin-like protein
MATTKKPIGTTGKDKINGTATAEKFEGFAGNDTLNGIGGNDTLDGGTGDDSLDGGIGNDSLLGGDGNDQLLGGTGNDFLSGDKDNDKLDGGAGNDTLNGGIGSDAMTGGDGNDYYVVDNKLDTVTETNKNDKLGGKDTVETALMNYTLGSNVENLILTGITDNTGTGNKLNNAITGNIGNNLLKGDLGNDSILGGDGDDTLDGGLGMDTLVGGAGADSYFMNNTEDKIIEDEQSPDEDQVIATVSYDLGMNPTIEILTLQGKKAVSGIGNELDNTLQESDGGTIANNFNGSSGNDVINAEGGNDTLEGGEGNDELNGGAGEDVAIYNGNEDDYQITPNIDVEGVAQLVIKYVGSDPTKIDEGEDILSDIEIVQFSDGTQKTVQTFIDESNSTEGDSSETESTEITDENQPTDEPVEDQPSNSPVDEVVPEIKPVKPAPKPTTSTGSANDKIAVPIEISMTTVKYGTKDADTIEGNNGTWFNGLGGNDTINSGIYESTLLGGAGNDSLIAGNNGDYLIGGSGVDHFSGDNYQSDTFIFGTGDTGIDAAHDVIEGFGVEYDKIDLAGATVVGSVGFGVELTLLDSKTSDMESFTAINQVRRWVDFENNQTLVQINLDKDFSTVEAEISLTGLLSLTEENFILTK